MTKKKVYSPVKPARSYEEQAKRLLDAHGLAVGDSERARRLLSTVNYYRLTTYGKHLRRADDPERFVDGVSLDTLYSLYEFDMGLRHLLLPVLEFFEIQLRAKIAYRLAMAHTSTGYMRAEHFRQDKLSQGAHKSLMNKFKLEVRRQGALPFVAHHKSKYGGQFPIWAAVELFTFGMLAQLYAIMTEEDQWAVSREERMSPEELSALMSAAVEVRNICAHYSRLYNQTIEHQPVLPGKWASLQSDRVFPTVLMLGHVAGETRVYAHMAQGIAQLEADFPEADLALCGFPKTWKALLGVDP